MEIMDQTDIKPDMTPQEKWQMIATAHQTTADELLSRISGKKNRQMDIEQLSVRRKESDSYEHHSRPRRKLKSERN